MMASSLVDSEAQAGHTGTKKRQAAGEGVSRYADFLNLCCGTKSLV